MKDELLDLSKLAIDRAPPGAVATRPHRRRWLSRYVVPIGILVGFLGLVGASAGRGWLPRQAVRVVPVIVKQGIEQPGGSTLFQAAGWVEPRPTAVSVPALAAGVIEALLVVEGQQVTEGEPIARLIAIDAELAVKQAAAKLKLREGELLRAEAERDAAVIRFEQPVHLRVQLADANSVLAKAKTEIAKLPFLIEAAEATWRYTSDNVQGKRAAQGSIAARIVQKAESEHASAQATLAELRSRQPNLEREIDALQNKVDAIGVQLELLVEERRQLDEAKAKVVAAAALRDEAELLLRQAELNHQRTTVRAPISGRILRLVASPGTRVMGLDASARQSSSTVVEMYDPARLQVRADVRLEDVPMVIPGAPVRIETASSGEVIHGRVLQSTSAANIQKNTLEVKVELIETPPMVTPEMLVTATFLAPKPSEASSEVTNVQRLFVPASLVRTVDGKSFVWAVNAENQAVRRPLKLGSEGQDGLVEALEGLSMTDKVISSEPHDLRDGDSVVVSGEDPTMGVE